MKLLKEHGWMCTSSAAAATERSLTGTYAGVLAGIMQHRSTRPLSICSGVEGKTTHNVQLTGRLLVLKHVELLVLTSYLERETGFSKANQQVSRDIDVHTRGGGAHPICLRSGSL